MQQARQLDVVYEAALATQRAGSSRRGTERPNHFVGVASIRRKVRRGLYLRPAKGRGPLETGYSGWWIA